MTDIVPNQLYPGGIMKQYADAVGGITYDQYAPGGCIKQLYDASGLADPLDQYAPGGPIGQIDAEIEGGSSTPDWVPANAVIHIDLVGGSPQGRAWVQGTGEVAVDTLLGSDPNTENGWAGQISEYNEENLTADGYVCPATISNLAFIGSARSMLLDTATIKVLYKQVATLGNVLAFALLSTDGNDAVELDLTTAASNRAAQAYSWLGPLSEEIAAIVNVNTGQNNATALTVTSTRFEFACNGSSAVAGVLSSTDRPPGNPLTGVILDTQGYAAVQSITIYAALPSTAGLSELSEV